MENVAHFHATGVLSANDTPARADYDRNENLIIRYDESWKNAIDEAFLGHHPEDKPNPICRLDGRYIVAQRNFTGAILISQLIRCNSAHGFWGNVYAFNCRFHLAVPPGEQILFEHYLHSIRIEPGVLYTTSISASPGSSVEDLTIGAGYLIMMTETINSA